ncbi:MAG: BrxE family protein [Syntrophales bacterium]
MTLTIIDFSRLFKLRLIVARHGEMDNARWWNTNKMLGQMGSIALKRGFPLTYHFAQARAVFEVASARSKEVFTPPQGTVTLWDLSAVIEDEFEDRYQQWLDDRNSWAPFFESIKALSGMGLLNSMKQFGLIDDGVIGAANSLRRSNENRSVALPGERTLDDGLVTLLAAAFALSEPGAPAIPYARLRSSY